MTAAATVGVRLVELLEEHGVDTVFGIPGIHTLELYRGLARSGIRHVSARHEQGAAFMADGYARASGRPGVCFLIAGPGVTNALTPLAQAARDATPILAVSTHANSDGCRRPGSLHALPDQRRLIESAGIRSVVVRDPGELPLLVADAFPERSARPARPLHIALAPELLAEPCPRLEAVGGTAIVPPAPDDEEIRAAAELLRRAERPLVILGGGGTGAAAGVLELAERLGAPIVLTGAAKGAVPPRHPLSLGTTIGLASVLELIRDADVVLAVASQLSEVEALPAAGAIELSGSLVRIDVDPQALASRPCAVALLGEASACVQALIGHCNSSSLGCDQAGRLAAVRQAIGVALDATGLTSWLNALQSAVDRGCTFALDSTELAYAAHRTLEMDATMRWFAPYAYGTLGCALPMAIGARAGSGRPSVALAGDGGVLFTAPELATAVLERLPVILVVWNNSEYREIRVGMERAGVPRIGCDTGSVDFPALARSLGCAATRVHSPDGLRGALQRFIEEDKAALIEVSAPESHGREAA